MEFLDSFGDRGALAVQLRGLGQVWENVRVEVWNMLEERFGEVWESVGKRFGGRFEKCSVV
jgi:class 3 adenylate cyclase